jgi:hypothetical protein
MGILCKNTGIIIGHEMAQCEGIVDPEFLPKCDCVSSCNKEQIRYQLKQEKTGEEYSPVLL